MNREEALAAGYVIPGDQATSERSPALLPSDIYQVGARMTDVDVTKVIAEAGKILARKPHDYVKDPFSGAGNCWCGAHEWAAIHGKAPYEPMPDSPTSTYYESGEQEMRRNDR
jgi:hypothetical protein